MEITRTANAGVLLKLDGVTILMDGVCREVKPYPATPPAVKAQLSADFPQIVAFTHAHKDHYDPAFANAYQRQTGRVIFGPELPGCKSSMEPQTVGAVKITPISSRHIGLAGKDTPHASFILQGSSCIWFLGDAAPTQWRELDLPKPDVLIVPYAYCTTPSAWAATQRLSAKAVVLVHMPAPEDDSLGLWAAVHSTVGVDAHIDPQIYISDMNETLTIQLPHD